MGPDIAIVGIDLASAKQAAVVTDHDSITLGRRMFDGDPWVVDSVLDWALPIAVEEGFTGVVVGCGPPATAGSPCWNAAVHVASRWCASTRCSSTAGSMQRAQTPGKQVLGFAVMGCSAGLVDLGGASLGLPGPFLALLDGPGDLRPHAGGRVAVGGEPGGCLPEVDHLGAARRTRLQVLLESRPIVLIEGADGISRQ